jgi:aminopeptidase N
MAYQSIIYNKTTLALNMLMELLGEESFYQGLNEFFRRHKYGAASTQDFIQTIEEISGKNLDVFFQSWFRSYSLPEVKVSHSVKKANGGYTLSLKIDQREVFIFPLWLEWIENGEKVKKMVVVDKINQEFEIRLEGKPTKIKINPNSAVPGKFH